MYIVFVTGLTLSALQPTTAKLSSGWRYAFGQLAFVPWGEIQHAVFVKVKMGLTVCSRAVADIVKAETARYRELMAVAYGSVSFKHRFEVGYLTEESGRYLQHSCHSRE